MIIKEKSAETIYFSFQYYQNLDTNNNLFSSVLKKGLVIIQNTSIFKKDKEHINRTNRTFTSNRLTSCSIECLSLFFGPNISAVHQTQVIFATDIV